MARPLKPWYRSEKDTWYARIEGRRISLGVRGIERVKEAHDAWHKLMAVGGRKLRKKEEVVIVAALIADFISDAQTRVKPITLSFYKRFLEPFAAKFGDLPCEKLTPTQAELWARKPTWSSSTRHDALGTLATCFRWAERSRLIERSPLHGLRLPPKESQGAEALISQGDYERLIQATTGDFQALIRFLWQTGCRPSEATELSAEAVDWENNCISLKKHKTAHRGKNRIIYLSAEALTVLETQRGRNETGPLFRNEAGTPFGRTTLAQKFWRISKRLGVRLTAYGFRHSFATDALGQGTPEAVVAELLGHCGTAMLHKHYSHLTARSHVLRDAVRTIRGQTQPATDLPANGKTRVGE